MTIHVTPIPKLTVLATPAFTLGTTNTAGAALTAVASNSTILTYDTTIPAIVAAASATGSATTAARRDHVHGGSDDIACRVTHDAAQAIANSTQVALAFNTETGTGSFDTDGMHDSSTNNSRITIQTAGKYLVNGNWAWEGSASGFRRGRLRVGGSTVIAMVQIDSPGANSLRQTISCIYSFAEDDYVELVVDQNSGGSLDVTSESVYSPIFSAIKILG